MGSTQAELALYCAPTAEVRQSRSMKSPWHLVPSLTVSMVFASSANTLPNACAVISAWPVRVTVCPFIRSKCSLAHVAEVMGFLTIAVTV